jgi:subtilisin family serine protease
MTSLDFDQLLDIGILRAALAGATGRDVHVAILDTGVDVTHPDLKGAVVRSVEVVAQYQGLVCREVPAGELAAAELDPVGHGTACAGIIRELAPEARLVSVRVIGASAAGTGEQFVRGLQWVLEQTEPRVQAVNLSLGTLQDRFAGPLRRLVDQAYYQGIVLVAAGNNMGVPSYPAVFASLLAVDNESYPEPTTFEFHTGRPVELAARGIYVRAPKSGGGYQLWTGTSFACPHITALVARLLSLNPALTPFQVKTLLHTLRANRDGGAGKS